MVSLSHPINRGPSFSPRPAKNIKSSGNGLSEQSTYASVSSELEDSASSVFKDSSDELDVSTGSDFSSLESEDFSLFFSELEDSACLFFSFESEDASSLESEDGVSFSEGFSTFSFFSELEQTSTS